MAEKEDLVELKKSILKTGFPLELEADGILRERKWLSNPSSYFIDFEQDKHREIDNRAYFKASKAESALSDLSVKLLLECKHVDEKRAVVVMPINQSEFHYWHYSGQTVDFPRLMEKRILEPWEDDLSTFYRFTNFHYKGDLKLIGVGRLIKIKNNPSEEEGKDLLYEGLMQLIKAQAYDVTSEVQSLKNNEMPPEYYLSFTFLCLLIDGRLCLARTKAGDIELEETNHAIIKMRFRPPYETSMVGYLVDVVRKDYFKNYLEVLEGDARMLMDVEQKHRSPLLDYFRPGGR